VTESATKRRRRAVIGVGDDRPELKARFQDTTDMGQRDAPLLVKPHLRRNLRACSLLVRDPVLREIQLERERPGEVIAEQDGRDRHLTIGHFAELAAVLAFDADRSLALFGKTRIVDREHAASHRHHVAQASPQSLCLPRRIGDEVLEGLVAGRVAQPSMYRLHGLPLAVVEQRSVPQVGRHCAIGQFPKRDIDFRRGRPIGSPDVARRSDRLAG
jgi:hypothetical protein